MSADSPRRRRVAPPQELFEFSLPRRRIEGRLSLDRFWAAIDGTSPPPGEDKT